MNLESKNDPELLLSVQSGSQDAFNEIIRRFEPLIQSLVTRYMSDGLFSQSDREDLYQEAVIALYSAAMSYDCAQSEVTFGLYAKICLGNSLNSALRRRRRQLAADEAQITEEGVRFDDSTEDAAILLARIDKILSPLERSVFRLFIHGYSHRFIAESLGKTEKSIDNAVYRIKKKLADKLM